MSVSIKRFCRIIRVLYLKGRFKINRKLIVYMVFVVISAIFWFINKTGSTITAQLDYDVEYFNFPKDKLVLRQSSTSNVKITVTALGAYLVGLHGKMPPLRIDLSKIESSAWESGADSTIKLIVADAIKSQIENQLPLHFKYVDINPDTICLEFGQSILKKVPVVLDAEISYYQQFRNAKPISVYPDSVDILGNIKIVDTINEIKTEFLKIKDLQENITRKLKLNTPEGIVCSNVYTDLNIEVEKFTEQIVELSVRQVNVPDSVTMRIFPPTVTVSFNVGWKNYGRAASDMFSVLVDYKDLVGQSVKPNILPVKLLRKPDLGLSDIKIKPEGVEYLIEQNSSFNDSPIEIFAEKK